MMLSAALSASLSSSTSSSLPSMSSSMTSRYSLSSSSSSSARISKRKLAFPVRAPSSLGYPEDEEDDTVRAKKQQRCLTVDIRGSGKAKTGILRWDTYDPNALAKQPAFMFSVTDQDGRLASASNSESIIDWFAKVPLVNVRCLGGKLGKIPRDGNTSFSISQSVERILRSGASPPHTLRAGHGAPVPPDTPSSLLPRNTILKMPESYVPASRRGLSSSAFNYPMRLKRTHSSSSLGNKSRAGSVAAVALQRTVSSDRVPSSTPPANRTLASLPLRRQPSRSRATTPLPPSNLAAPPSLPNIALLPAVNIESPQPTAYSTTSQHSQLSAISISDAETEEAIEQEDEEEEYRPKRKRAAPASVRASPSPPTAAAASASNPVQQLPVKRPRGRPPKKRDSLAVSANEYDSEASSVSNKSRAGIRSSKRKPSAAGATRATSESPPAAVMLLPVTQARRPSVVQMPIFPSRLGSTLSDQHDDAAAPYSNSEIQAIPVINTSISKEPNYTTLPSPVPLQAVALGDTIPRSSPLTQAFPSSISSLEKDIPVPHSDSPGTLIAQIKLAVEASK